jgi:hypothetical protein
MLEFHPVELAEIESKHQSPQTPEAVLAKRRLPYLLGYAAIAVLLLLGIFQFVTFEKTALDTINPVVQVTTDEPPTLQPSSEHTPADGSETQGNQALNLMWPLGAHQDGISFNNWDSQSQVDRECSTCHTSEGLPDFLSTGLTASQPASGGLFCTTCHNDPSTFTTHDISSVIFPSGASSQDLTAQSNLCITCHMGSASGNEIDISLAALGQDTVNEDLEFIDIHGATPGATMYGTDAQGAYEYAEHSYFGLRLHTSDFGSCSDCHDPHLLLVDATTCEDCHSSFDVGQQFTSIRFSRIDYDGDSDTNEGIGEEIESLQSYLYLVLQNYAAENSASSIVYNAGTAPYFFVDLNGNGVIEEDETKLENRFAGWTPRLLKAAFNFHYAVLDSGGFAHHPKYIIQILYDSLEDLGADVSNLTRP